SPSRQYDLWLDLSEHRVPPRQQRRSDDRNRNPCPTHRLLSRLCAPRHCVLSRSRHTGPLRNLLCVRPLAVRLPCRVRGQSGWALVAVRRHAAGGSRAWFKTGLFWVTQTIGILLLGEGGLDAEMKKTGRVSNRFHVQLKGVETL